jgi:signal transduction histidine kinase
MAAGRDLWARRKDATEVAVDISLSPIHTDDGAVVVATVRDVTERRSAEEAARTALERERAAAEQLRELDKMKDALLVAVSHELRTPLTVIRGLAATLQRRDIQSAPVDSARLLKRLDVNAVRLERLLMNLLDLDRLRRGILVPQRQPVSVGGLVRRLLDTVDLGDHSVEVEDTDAIASVDAGQFERIVENLVTNAAKYTPPGTTIWVRLQREAGGLLLTVDDQGPGVPDGMKAAVFEAFRQGDSSMQHAPGTGIGLSLVARFAELHGGRAWVEDRAGGGASFRVHLSDTSSGPSDAGTHEPTAEASAMR